MGLRLPAETRALYLEVFKEVMQASNLPFGKVLDCDLACRTLSATLPITNELCRYYFRYSILVIYTYDPQMDFLIGVRCLRIGDPETSILVPYSYPFIIRLNDFLTTQFPEFVAECGYGYKCGVRFIYTNYPFEDESQDIINQDFAIDDTYTTPPLTHPTRQGTAFAIVKVGEVDYVVKLYIERKGGIANIKALSMNWFDENDDTEQTFVPLRLLIESQFKLTDKHTHKKPRTSLRIDNAAILSRKIENPTTRGKTRDADTQTASTEHCEHT